MSNRSTPQVIELMMRFAERTGLTTDRSPRRYLWTDAFATCNFLGLAHATGETRYHELALRLVDRVHHTLGRHRPDDARRGWISGLGDADGEAHPTLGGLRIGKPLRERAPGEPLDDRLEWDRDGQYFHYLTKWMHALDQVACSTGEAKYVQWARELADAAYRMFVSGPPARRRMVWKLSIDLTRPQVASMGQHDPLDGYVTCLQLDATARALSAGGPDLADATKAYRSMIDPRGLATSDPLGIGGLLFDAARLDQLGADRPLRDALLEASDAGLRHYLVQPDLFLGAERRLGFRELGLAIGGAAIGVSRGIPHAKRYAPVKTAIESFWLDPAHRASATWMDHEDINDVMLATSLAPSGFVVLSSLAGPVASAIVG
jgi:hypothetical protein